MTRAKGHIRPDSIQKQNNLTRRAAFVGIALLAAPSTALAASVSPDPILALVERYMAAATALKNADTGKSKISNRDFDAVYDEHMASFEAVISETPVTVAGCVAVLRCVQVFGDCLDAPLFNDWYEPVSNPASTLLARLSDVLDRLEARS